VSEDPVAHHDRLVARVETDVDVQAEGHDPPYCLLEELDQVKVSLAGGDGLVLPSRERVRSSPEGQHPMDSGNVLDGLDLRCQVTLDLLHVLAHGGVDLEIALKQLRLDRTVKLLGKAVEHVEDTAPKSQGPGVDKVELELDAERGTGAGGKSVGAQGRVLPIDSASKITL